MAYVVLLLTLFLPFSRCSNQTSNPANGPGSSPPATAPSARVYSPWYHLFEKNTDKLTYQYGIDVAMDGFDLPRQWDSVLMVPGRTFYLWPIAILLLIPRVRTRGWRIGLGLVEVCLAAGGLYWVQMAAVMATAMRGVWIASGAIAIFFVCAVIDLVRAIRQRPASPASLWDAPSS